MATLLLLRHPSREAPQQHRDGYVVNDLIDVISLDPDTGTFGTVGLGQVSADGQSVETVQGGIRRADWHFILRPERVDPEDVDYECDCRTMRGGSSSGPGASTSLNGTSLSISMGGLVIVLWVKAEARILTIVQIVRAVMWSFLLRSI